MALASGCRCVITGETGEFREREALGCFAAGLEKPFRLRKLARLQRRADGRVRVWSFRLCSR